MKISHLAAWKVGFPHQTDPQPFPIKITADPGFLWLSLSQADKECED